MQRNIIIALLLLTGLFSSCKDAIKERPISTYYDVNELVNTQFEKMYKQNPSLAKHISIDGEEESDTITFDSLGWKNELEIFKLADINKPTLKDLYTATELTTDTGTILNYQSKKDALGIAFLKVYFSKDSLLQKIEALYNEKNNLYSSKRNLEMQFQQANGEPLLSAYRVYGSQKMIMKDEVSFSISSSVVAN